MKLIIKLNSEIIYEGSDSLYCGNIPNIGDRIAFDGDERNNKPCKQYYSVITRTFEANKFNSLYKSVCILQVEKQ